MVVVNAVGDVVDEAGRVLAGPRADLQSTLTRAAGTTPDDRPLAGTNTTIGVVATDLSLDKAGATLLAQAAHDGLARAVRPAHTAFDGDTFFALSTARELPRTWPVPVAITAAAAEMTALAIRRAVQAARGLGGVPGLADRDQPNAPEAGRLR
jgi:L-aminopeptidase/D-esterase-like protein